MIKNKNLLTILLFIFFIVSYFTINIHRISENRVLVGDDVPNHLVFSIEVYYKINDILSSQDSGFASKLISLVRLISEPVDQAAPTYSNFVYITTYPVYRIFGKNLFSARLSNFLYLLILIFAVYHIGKELISGPGGLLSVFITLMFPYIFEPLRQYGLDLPMTALSSLGILFLIKSDGLRDIRYCTAFGLSAGIGMLIKPQCAVIIGIPLLVVAVKTVFFRHSEKKKSWINIIINSSVIILITAMLFQLWPGKSMIPLLFGSFNNSNFPYSFYFLKSIFGVLLGPVPAVILIISVFYWIKTKNEHRFLAAAWIIAPIFGFYILFLTHFYKERFLMPILPIAAILISWTVLNIRLTKIRAGALIVSVVFFYTQFLFLSYSRPKIADMDHTLSYLENMKHHPVGIFNHSPFGYMNYKNDPFNAKGLVSVITDNSTTDKEISIITVICSAFAPTAFELRYWTKIAGRQFDLQDIAVNFGNAHKKIDTADFIVFGIPPSLNFKGWPDEEHLTYNMHTSSDYFTLRRLQKHFSEEYTRFTQKFSSYQMLFEHMETVGSPRMFKWYIYKRIRSS
ncbi:MAG: glycosyltransferase family 39 protein [Elusimicrobiota bacterium]